MQLLCFIQEFRQMNFTVGILSSNSNLAKLKLNKNNKQTLFKLKRTSHKQNIPINSSPHIDEHFVLFPVNKFEFQIIIW